MNDDKRRQKQLRRVVYMMAGAYILYQAYSMGMEVKNGAVVDNVPLLVGAILLFIVAGLALIIYNGLKLKKESREED